MLAPLLEKAKKENPNLASNPRGLLSKIDREARKKVENLEGKRDKFIADSGMGPMPPPGRDLRLYGDGLDSAILRGAMRNCSLGGEVR